LVVLAAGDAGPPVEFSSVSTAAPGAGSGCRAWLIGCFRVAFGSAQRDGRTAGSSLIADTKTKPPEKHTMNISKSFDEPPFSNSAYILTSKSALFDN